MTKLSTYKNFKVGDTITEVEGNLWAGKEFIISSFHGSSYSMFIHAYMKGKSRTIKNACNFDIREARLINAVRRPLSNLKKVTLIKLMQKGNVEARREFLIRNNKVNKK